MSEKILVVDDDLDTLRLVGMMLERQGFTILAASSGQQALALARAEKPDLVVLDLMMPDLDGIQVARQLRSDPLTAPIRIVMFTARTQMTDKLEGLDAGADEYLTKPIQPRELIAHVRSVLRSHGSRATALNSMPGERGIVIGVIAPKGGVGVSTVALNTGIALNVLSQRSVIVADFRPGCGTIGPELGLANPQGLNRLLNLSPSAVTTELVGSELVEHPTGLRLLLSSSDPADAQKSVFTDHFAAVARILPFLAERTVLDLGAGMTPLAGKAIDSCDGVILVFEPVEHTVAGARSLYEHLIKTGKNKAQIIPALVNRWPVGMRLSLDQVQHQFSRPIMHVFPAVPDLAYQAQITTKPMFLCQPDEIISGQFTNLARSVMDLERAVA